MQGELIDGEVLVHEPGDASRIYNKGYYGVPEKDRLRLGLIEAIFLAEINRIEIYKASKKLTLHTLITKAVKLRPEFEIKYLVYRDIRKRGYVIRASRDAHFDVYARGKTPKARPKYALFTFSERATFDLNKVFEILREIGRKILLVGIVDEEGDLTYYRIDKKRVKSSMEGEEANQQGESFLLEDRVMVFDKALADRLHTSAFYGKLVEDNLQLSLLETAHLLGRNFVRIRNAKTGKDISKSFVKRARALQPDFDLRFRVYEDLKERNLIPKTGFKYGAHFRVYDGPPEEVHARFLVHALPPEYQTSWSEISRAVRLAHGVKKQMIFARVHKKINYLRIGRVRP